MTDYLWKDILTKERLTLIIENYAQVVVEVDEDTKKKKEKQIFPRYHQLDVVTKLLADVKTNGVGKKYLIQHSAGSGKSNSIAWLAHQLIGLEQDGRPMLDSVIVVTDRRILDKQIRDTIKQFMQVAARLHGRSTPAILRKPLRMENVLLSPRLKSSHTSFRKSERNTRITISPLSSMRLIPDRAEETLRR